LLDRPVISSIYVSGRDRYARPLLMIRMGNILSAVVNADDNQRIILLAAIRKLLIFWLDVVMSLLIRDYYCETFSCLMDYRGNDLQTIQTLLEDQRLTSWIKNMTNELREIYPSTLHSVYLLGLSDGIRSVLLSGGWWTHLESITKFSKGHRPFFFVQKNHDTFTYGNDKMKPIDECLDLNQVEVSCGGLRVNFCEWRAFVKWMQATIYPVSHSDNILKRFENLMSEAGVPPESRGGLKFTDMCKPTPAEMREDEIVVESLETSTVVADRIEHGTDNGSVPVSESDSSTGGGPSSPPAPNSSLGFRKTIRMMAWK